MNKLLALCTVLLFSVNLLAQSQAPKSEIRWMTWQEAISKVSTDKNPKKIFVDVYTDWCGWCKKMDQNTFNDPEVAAYMQKHFYMVKMDAEGKDTINYKGYDFKFIRQGRNGYHELAAMLLQGRLSFPTVVFMDEKQNLLSPVPGYMEPATFIQIARYFGDDAYKTQKWPEYQKASQSKTH